LVGEDVDVAGPVGADLVELGQRVVQMALCRIPVPCVAEDEVGSGAAEPVSGVAVDGEGLFRRGCGLVWLALVEVDRCGDRERVALDDAVPGRAGDAQRLLDMFGRLVAAARVAVGSGEAEVGFGLAMPVADVAGQAQGLLVAVDGAVVVAEVKVDRGEDVPRIGFDPAVSDAGGDAYGGGGGSVGVGVAAGVAVDRGEAAQGVRLASPVPVLRWMVRACSMLARASS
jgi:hypothetical protein